MNNNLKCEKCDNLGYYPAANGEDDYAYEFCTCQYGNVFRDDILAEVAHND